MLRRKEIERENDGKKSRKEERKKEMKEGKNRENNTGMGGEKQKKKGGSDYCLIYVVSSLHLRLLPHQSIAGL